MILKFTGCSSLVLPVSVTECVFGSLNKMDIHGCQVGYLVPDSMHFLVAHSVNSMHCLLNLDTPTSSGSSNSTGMHRRKTLY
jgi:hypothetical protein